VHRAVGASHRHPPARRDRTRTVGSTFMIPPLEPAAYWRLASGRSTAAVLTGSPLNSNDSANTNRHHGCEEEL